MKQESYKILIEQEGVNHVMIFKGEGNGYVNDWNFPLKGDDEPIVFSKFYTPTKFAVVNWDGWVRAYDASTKEHLLDYKLNGKVNTSAILSLDKSKLYVAFSQDSNQRYLAIFDLDSFQVEVLELPDDIYGNSLDIRKDDNLLFYKHDWERVNGIKTYKHFYSMLDLNTRTIEQFELPYAPQFSFGEFKPVIDTANNRVIMPAYEDVVTKANALDEVLFEFRIIMFDLNTFVRTNLVSVRDFSKNQLGCSLYECEQMATLFLASERNKDYTNALREYYENLTTIKVVSDGIWLCWRSGILRKISSDFSLSPLLVTSSRSNSSEKGMFKDAYFHSHLYHIDSLSIILAEHTDFYKTAMPNLDHSDIETPIALELEKTSLEEIYQMSYSVEKSQEIKKRDQIQIEVEDLSVDESIISALSQIEKIVSDINASGMGSILIFTINDAKGQTWQEPDFFAKAIVCAPEGIKTIIEKFILYPKAKYLYRNEEETALCYAVFELAKKGEAYLEITFQYLSAIDMDHDVFNRENLIPYLEETYTTKELKQKMKSVSKALYEWYSDYCEA